MQIEMMETIAQNSVSYLDQNSEFIPQLQISQPMESYETNEATNQTRKVHEKKYEKFTWNTEVNLWQSHLKRSLDRKKFFCFNFLCNFISFRLTIRITTARIVMKNTTG